LIWQAILREAWKPVAALLALLSIYLAGRQGASQRAKSEALRDYAETRKKADDADIPSDDPAVLRDWLRERGKH
jgi:hypothetical protein